MKNISINVDDTERLSDLRTEFVTQNSKQREYSLHTKINLQDQ